MVDLRLGHTSCLEKETNRGASFSFRSNCTANFLSILVSSYREILTASISIALAHSISPNIDNFVLNLFVFILTSSFDDMLLLFQ